MQRTLSPLDPSYFEKPKMSAFEFFGIKIDEIPVKTDLIPQITRVKFCRCQLKHLPPGLAAYHYLKYVDISENDFEEVTGDEFAGLVLVQYLDMSLNHITKVSSGIPTTLVHIDFSYNTEIDTESVWNLNLPHLETLRLTHCKLSTLPTTPAAWASTLHTLVLDGNDFTEVPKAALMLPELTELSLFGNEIVRFSMPQNNQLYKIINLTQNPLKEIDKNISVKVQTMYVNSCPIGSIPQPLVSLPGIRVLMLSNTGLTGKIDFQLPAQIAILDISHNKITELSQQFVQSCGTASIINLADNELEEIPDMFPTPNCLSQILLSHNKLKKLPKTMMESKRLEKFYVSHNQLTEIPEFRFPQVREFDVSFNQLTEIPDCFVHSSFMVTVNVSFNKLKDLPKSLASCRRLIDLYAAGNELTALPRCIFGFASLRMLVLSKNKLTALPQALGSFFFLKILDLSNNHFVEIPKQIETLHSLKQLSLSHNLISSVKPGFKFPNMLSSLDLSFNCLTELPALNFTQNLVALNVSCNNLKTRNIGFIKGLHFFADFGNKVEEDRSIYDDMKALRIIESFDNVIDPPDVPKKHIMIPGFSKKLDTGYSSMLGIRPTMEDAVYINSLSDDDQIIALFDGHAGFGAADACAKYIGNEYVKIMKVDNEYIPQVMSSAFGNIEATLAINEVDGGCTAAVAIICKGKVYAAGIGDSRIVRVKKNSYERVTVDQKPLNTDEYYRLKKKGLGVTAEGRIWKKLAVARALGDFWCGEGLFEQPDVVTFEIEEDDLGIIVACDGLWDVFDDESAAEIVRESKSGQDAAITLKNCGIALGTMDNISVAVALFKEGGFRPENTVEKIPILKIEESENSETMSVPHTSGRRRR